MPRGVGAAFLDLVDVGADDGDLAVLDLVHLGHLDQLGALGFAAAHLAVKVLAAHALALVSRSEGHRDVDRGHLDLQAAHLYGFLHHVGMRHVGHHVLVSANTGRQNLGNVRVGDGGETPVDAAGRGRGPVGADFAQGVDEGEDAVLVVEQHAFVVAGLHPAEGHGGAVGEAQCENGRGNIRPEGHDAGVPADLHPGLEQLLGHRGVVVLSGQEDVKAAFLVLFDNQLGGLGVRCRADDGGKAGGRSVHELDATLAENGVVGRAQPDLAGLLIDLLCVQIEVRLVEVAQGFTDLEAEERRHAGVQQRPEVRQVVRALDVRRQQFAHTPPLLF